MAVSPDSRSAIGTAQQTRASAPGASGNRSGVERSCLPVRGPDVGGRIPVRRVALPARTPGFRFCPCAGVFGAPAATGLRPSGTRRRASQRLLTEGRSPTADRRPSRVRGHSRRWLRPSHHKRPPSPTTAAVRRIGRPPRQGRAAHRQTRLQVHALRRRLGGSPEACGQDLRASRWPVVYRDGGGR
jgi:hypothetical protein